jgi:curli biogenesis system outer membrane secretion channel CsgG
MQNKIIIVLISIGVLSSCATVQRPTEPVDASVTKAVQQEAQSQAQLPQKKRYKQKIVIGRFTNETNYGKTLLVDDSYDPIGKQASDMLATRLITSDRFLVFERPDLNKIEAEQKLTNQQDLIGADVIIFGSVTEFGRSVTGTRGFLSGTKLQTAKAKVELRLVDTKTALAFFSTTGAGVATTESGEVMGFGNKAGYDATLNDKVIGAAISDLINNLIISLENRPWKTDILQIQDKRVYIGGGKSQGLKVGDTLQVVKKTTAVKSQSGFTIDLPPEKVAKIEVVSFFGDNETNEGSVAEITEGSLDKEALSQYIVREVE